MEPSITQAGGSDGVRDLKASTPTEAERPAEEAIGTGGWAGLSGRLWGIGLVILCLIVYYFSQPNRGNTYLHFVLQAQSWLEGKTAIPTPGYQDVMPILDSSGQPTGLGIIPFPPLPAWVDLPFVAIWHLATNEQLLATVFAAIDVGIAYWMLGYLRVRHDIRVLTSLFLGLGTVLWYAAAIGSTWFFAHVVALACLLISLGLALSADRDASDPQPLRDVVAGIRRFGLPGGRLTLALLVALAGLLGILLVLAGAGTPPAALDSGLVEAAGGTPAAVMAGVGLLLGIVAAALAFVVAGKPAVLAPFAILVVVVAGLPALLMAGAVAPSILLVIDAILVVAVVGLWSQLIRRPNRVDRAMAGLQTALSSPEAVQVAAGIFFGLAVTARLTILLGFPFLMLVGGGGTWLRRGLLAGAGAAVPLVTLLVVTYATSGYLFNPAYVFQYHKELQEYGAVLGYNAGWAISDIRYVPHNLMIMLFGAPEITPPTVGVYGPDYGTAACVTSTARGLFDSSCPLVMPNAVGTSILLTSPAYLLGLLAWRPLGGAKIDRATAGATIAVLAIAVVNLMHFSQGWVQFGYRFSNDFAPFALILVAVGASRLGRRWPVVLLVAASIVVNFWGTTWGVILGW
ncbi:MAG TPA: hypothetical protein VGE81_01390 [Candidatus Limnocylindrales bacterium]